MDPDGNESNGEDHLPDQTPSKTRTLFHYFKSNSTDEKKRKISPNISNEGPPEKRPKEENLVDGCKETGNADSVERIRDDILVEEASKPKTKSINTFFKKLSKDEYKKEIDRQSASSVLTVTAMIHSPSPEPLKVVPQQRPAEVKKKRSKKSNVSRSSRETDTITVVETEEEKFQPNDENAVSGLTQSPLNEKISPTFFRHNPNPCRSPELDVNEVSIDDELFFKLATKNENSSKKGELAATVITEKVLESRKLKNENVTIEAPKKTMIPCDKKSSDEPSAAINTKKVLESNKITKEGVTSKVPTKIAKKVVTLSGKKSTGEPTSILTVEKVRENIKIKDESVTVKVTAKVSTKRASSEQNSTDSPAASLGANKISNKLFGNKKKVEHSNETDEDSVDIDFSNVFSKGVLSNAKPSSDFKDVSALQPIEKPKMQLFKTKLPKKNAKASVMYDSDSIDLDVLASFNSKTFCSSDVNGFVTESDESCSSGITALMKKPLSKPPERQILPQHKMNSQRRNPEEPKPTVVNENNAFEKMMAMKPKAGNSSEILSLQDQEKAKKGRHAQPKVRRKSARDIPELPGSDSSEFEDGNPSKEKLRGRKKSGRRSSGNKENALSFEKSKSSAALDDILENPAKDLSSVKTPNQLVLVNGDPPSNVVKVYAVYDAKLVNEEIVEKQTTNAFKKLMSTSKSKQSSNELSAMPQAAQVPETLTLDPPCDISNLSGKESPSSEPTVIPIENCKAEKASKKASKTVAPPEASDENKPPSVRRTSARIKTNLENSLSRASLYLDSDNSNDSISNRKLKRKAGEKSLRHNSCSEDSTSLKLTESVSSPAKKKTKQSGKLAPIFTKGKKSSSIVIEDPEKVAARLAFLHSSVPESLKNQIAFVHDENLLSNIPVLFPSISHVRQIDDSCSLWSLPMKNLNLRELSPFDPPIFDGKIIKYFTKTVETPVSPTSSRNRLAKETIYGCLKSLIAREPSNFDVMRVFSRYLERKLDSDQICEEAWTKNVPLMDVEEARKLRSERHKRRSKVVKEPLEVKFDPDYVSSMQWTMKYAPLEAGDVIGNTDTMKKFQNWLREWETYDRRKKHEQGNSQNTMSDCSSSDFTSSSEDESEENLTSKVPNTALLLGPCGIGKTCAVYALAREMGFKVLEVNASNGRSGKQVLSSLREATQSHNVRKRRKSDGKKQSLLSKKKSNFLAPQTQSLSGVTKLDRTAVILFEDIDIIFEEVDEGFYSAVNSLIATTKRPIIMTSSNPFFLKSSRALQLKHTPQAFSFKTPDPVIVAKHLQLMALCEGYMVDFECIKYLALLHGSNISKLVQTLHFWTTCGVGVRINTKEFKINQDLSDDNPVCKIMGIGKCTPQQTEIHVPVIQECHLRSVGIREHLVGSLAEENGVLEAVIDNGLLDLVEHNIFNLLPLNRIQKSKLSQDQLSKKNSVKSANQNHEPSHFDFPEKSSTVQSKNELSSSPEGSQVKLSNVRATRCAIESISNVLDTQSQFFLNQRDSSPWWSTSTPTGPKSEGHGLKSEIAACLFRGVLNRTRESLSECQLVTSDVLNIYSECKKSGVDVDMVASSNEFRRKSSSVKHRNLIHRAQKDVLNSLLPELILGVKPLPVDLLPVVRTIVRSENQRKADGLSTGGGKRSRSGRFVHYFASQCITIHEQSLQKLCDGLH